MYINTRDNVYTKLEITKEETKIVDGNPVTTKTTEIRERDGNSQEIQCFPRKKRRSILQPDPKCCNLF